MKLSKRDFYIFLLGVCSIALCSYILTKCSINNNVVIDNKKSKEQIRLEKNILISDSIIVILKEKQNVDKNKIDSLSKLKTKINIYYDSQVQKIRLINNNDSIVGEFNVIFTKNNIK